MLGWQYEINCFDKKLGIANQCYLKEKFLNINYSTRSLGQIRQATIKRNYRGKTVQYNLVLNTANGEDIELNHRGIPVYSLAKKIEYETNNYILAGRQDYFVIPFTYTFEYVFFFIAFISISFGTYSFIFTRNVTIFYRKIDNSLTIKQLDLIKKSTNYFHLEDQDKIGIMKEPYKSTIQFVYDTNEQERKKLLRQTEYLKNSPYIKESFVDANVSQEKASYQLAIVHKNGEMVPITDIFTNEYNKIRKIAYLMNNNIQSSKF